MESGNANQEDRRKGVSEVDTAAAEAALKAKLSRKRTKTGCLTCRKRRIKCGEQRPVCRNCVKSRRHCEGYSSRVQARQQPAYDYQPAPNGGAHIIFQAVREAVSNAPPKDPSLHNIDPAVYSDLRPRCTEQYHHTVFDHRTQQYITVEQPPQHNDHHRFPGHVDQNTSTGPPSHSVRTPPNPLYTGMADGQHAAVPYYGVHQVPSSSGPVSAGHANPPFHAIPTNHAQHAHPPAQGQNGLAFAAGPLPVYNDPAQVPHSWTISDSTPGAQLRPWTETNASRHQTSFEPAGASQVFNDPQTPASIRQQQWIANAYTPRPELAQSTDYQPSPPLHHHHEATPPISFPPSVQASNHVTPEYYDQELHGQSNLTPTYMLSAAAVEVFDDDYYDVASDEEMDIEDASIQPDPGSQQQRTLSRILAMNQITVREMQMRRYDTFLYEGILDHYRVEQVANPLKNAATARVFAHFISATGPSLSIFERHPRNTSVLFTEGSVPFAQQGLWTYTMPMAALRNQGLLQAMLALASLHIARLQGASETPSMQHYAWALKRIHHCVGHPKKRLKLTTIAASMLLGFYEIMTADHMKWNMHLAGSKQLFVEVDFVKLTQKFRRMKMQRSSMHHSGTEVHSYHDHPPTQGDLLDQISDVDERVISHLIGREVRYDGHGHVEEAQAPFPPNLDVNKFEILKDLYWWYCKQDVYQSIVSGNVLLMDYNRWANCPPRAPLGKADAVYGSFDHLMLLLGRIANFAARDRERKLKQVEANGGQWRPAPGMNIARPTQSAQPPTPVSATNSLPGHGSGLAGGQAPAGPPPAMPQFYGMAPPPRDNVQMPSSYNSMYNAHTPQSAQAPNGFDYDLQASTQAALEEYGRIRAALRTFKTSLGVYFEPLTSEYQAPIDTPFGAALFYRSYDIGCLWAVYNMAEIIAIRSHPHMPPAMHVAAAVAASETSYFANEIGRIAAGIVPGPPDVPLNPSLGAALNESCMPSFFAAVQYQDLAQRHSTVARIFSIARRTGWGSAELIANGCETAWVKAAAAGRGPPYSRIARPEYSDDARLNGSWEQLDPNAAPDETDDGDRRLVKKKPGARLNWALGVIGVEEDVQKISISG